MPAEQLPEGQMRGLGVRTAALSGDGRAIAHRILRAFLEALQAIGLAIVIVLVLAWWTRDDLAAWYRSLPVVIAAWHCPGNQ